MIVCVCRCGGGGSLGSLGSQGSQGSLRSSTTSNAPPPHTHSTDRFSSLTTVLPGLRTLPALRELQLTTTNIEETQQIITALPMLERLNGRSTANAPGLRRQSYEDWQDVPEVQIGSGANSHSRQSSPNDHRHNGGNSNSGSSFREGYSRPSHQERRGRNRSRNHVLRHPPPSPPRVVHPQVTLSKNDLEAVAVVMSAIKTMLRSGSVLLSGCANVQCKYSLEFVYLSIPIPPHKASRESIVKMCMRTN